MKLLVRMIKLHDPSFVMFSLVVFYLSALRLSQINANIAFSS